MRQRLAAAHYRLIQSVQVLVFEAYAVERQRSQCGYGIQMIKEGRQVALAHVFPVQKAYIVATPLEQRANFHKLVILQCHIALEAVRKGKILQSGNDSGGAHVYVFPRQ